jgi:hypothetical protein
MVIATAELSGVALYVGRRSALPAARRQLQVEA